MFKKTEEKNEKFKIAIDVMSGDFGCEPAIDASIEFIKTNPDASLILIGDREKIYNAIAKKKKNFSWANLRNKIEIMHAKENLNMDDDLLEIYRKKDSSLSKAYEILKDKKVDGLITAASTKLLIYISQILLEKIANINKIAFMPSIPSLKKKEILLIDAGANLEIDPYDLITFSCIGNIYAKEIMNIKEPKIGILNIAEEKNKGRKLERNAYKMLEKLNENKLISFSGNQEAREIMNSNIDILVTDGFSGNIFLKSIEGMAETIFKIWKNNYQKSSFFKKIFYFFLKKDLSKIKNKFFYKNLSAAPLVGIKNTVIKVHGNSDMNGYLAGLNLSKKIINNKSNEKITEKIEKLIEKCKNVLNGQDELNN